jgi:hypothetical protein
LIAMEVGKAGVFLGTLDEVDNSVLRPLSRTVLKIKDMESKENGLEIDLKILSRTLNEKLDVNSGIILKGETLEESKQILFSIKIGNQNFTLVFLKPILSETGSKHKLTSLAQINVQKYIHNKEIIEKFISEQNIKNAFLNLNAVGRIYDKVKQTSYEAIILDDYDFLYNTNSRNTSDTIKKTRNENSMV